MFSDYSGVDFRFQEEFKKKSNILYSPETNGLYMVMLQKSC
jgi:hypothetical protein